MIRFPSYPPPKGMNVIDNNWANPNGNLSSRRQFNSVFTDQLPVRFCFRFCFASLSVVALVLVATPVVSSQQVLLTIGGKNTGRQDVENMLASYKQGCINRLHITVEDMKQVISLDADAERKLKVAAKGAAQQATLELRKKLEPQLEQFQGHAGIVEKDDEGDEADGENNSDEEDDDQQQMLERQISFVMQIPSVNDVSNSKLWRKAVNRLLTDDQHVDYREWKDQRSAFMRKSAVQNFVAEADRKLMLNDEQRKKLTKVISANFGVKMGKKLENKTDDQSFVRMTSKMLKPNRAFDDLVSGFLTKSQLDEWRRTLAHKLIEFD